MPLKILDLGIGVMQGRLLPKFEERFQAHPVDYWHNEFPLAAQLGLCNIEFIFDVDFIDKNPLMMTGGIDDIQRQITEHNILVVSVCADYFMRYPVHSADATVREHSMSVLRTLIRRSALLNVKDIVLPCVDESSLNSPDDIARLLRAFEKISLILEEQHVNIALETDLAPEAFLMLLQELPDCFTVNYDTGNSASNGFPSDEEFAAYGHRITDIHIKDRTLNGGSVPLGNGATDFTALFNYLQSSNYTGTLVMQSYRDDDGYNIFKTQLEWFVKKAEKHYAG